MIIVHADSFIENIEKIKDATILKRAEQAIEKLFVANSIREVTGIKAIQGWPTYYRLRFGDFRIGFKLKDEQTIILLAIEHRSKIYKNFP